MGFTIEDALNETKNLYQLTLLCGEKGCANAMSWVHLIEDTTTIQQLWGKELIVTSGLGFQKEGALLKLVEYLVKYHSVGLIINTGKYIFEVPQDVLDYCEANDFPLLVSPWHIHMMDLIKDFCMRCLFSQREDYQITQYFQNIFSDPRTIEENRVELMRHFDVDGSFQVLLINIEDASQYSEIERRKLSMQLQLYFEKIECPYSFFWYDGYYVLIVNNLLEDVFLNLVHSMYRRAKGRMKVKSLYVGIGTKMSDIRQLHLSYQRALSAVALARLFEKNIMCFDEMGIYQILFSIQDQKILSDMYHHLLDVLIRYDQKHHGELEKTLYYYLKYEGSPQKIAKNMYTHRNTVNYRIEKIKKLLNNDLDTFEDKFPYMMAFYIAKMMK